jgi:hypothetical protein
LEIEKQEKNMSFPKINFALLPVIFCLFGCSGLTQVQDSVTKFDQGAHSVSTTQMAFLKSAQLADCDFQFYQAALDFNVDPAPIPAKSLSISGVCSPVVVQNQDLVTRQKLMDAITLYADQIQAVAATGSDKTLSTNSQTAAADLNNLAKNHGILSTAGLPIASDVEAAVIGLTGMVLSAKQLSDIKASANAQSSNLKSVVGFLKNENAQIATNMAAKAASLANILNTTLSEMKENGMLVTDPNSKKIVRGNDPRLLLDAIATRRMLMDTDPAGTTVTISGTPVQDPVSAAEQLNSALDSLVSANDAIANAGTGGIVAAVSDLVARAQAAQAMQAALNK